MVRQKSTESDSSTGVPFRTLEFPVVPSGDHSRFRPSKTLVVQLTGSYLRTAFKSFPPGSQQVGQFVLGWLQTRMVNNFRGNTHASGLIILMIGDENGVVAWNTRDSSHVTPVTTRELFCNYSHALVIQYIVTPCLQSKSEALFLAALLAHESLSPREVQAMPSLLRDGNVHTALLLVRI